MQNNSSNEYKLRLKKNGINYTDDYGIDATILQHFLHFHNRPIVKYSYTCASFSAFNVVALILPYGSI